MPDKTILLVEDNPGDVRLLREMFATERPDSYEIIHMPRLGLALNRLAKGGVDIVLLDLGLPAGDGFVVLERLKNDDRLCDIPVIVLTARDPQSSEQRVLKSGATAFFQKPADNAELLEVIRATLPKVSLAAPLPS